MIFGLFYQKNTENLQKVPFFCFFSWKLQFFLQKHIFFPKKTQFFHRFYKKVAKSCKMCCSFGTQYSKPRVTRILTITRTTSQKVENFWRKVTKNSEKWRKMTKKGKKWLFFKFFRDLNAKIPKNMRSKERLLPRSRIFIQQLSSWFFCISQKGIVIFSSRQIFCNWKSIELLKQSSP